MPKNGALDVTCPTCKAKVNDRCRNYDGQRLEFSFHWARIKAAKGAHNG